GSRDPPETHGGPAPGAGPPQGSCAAPPRIARGWPVMARVRCTTPRAVDVMSALTPRPPLTTPPLRFPPPRAPPAALPSSRPSAPRSALQSSHSLASLLPANAAVMRSSRFATITCSAFTLDGESAVYTIMAPFLSATTCERAPSARASWSISIQSSHATQSWMMPFWCAAQRMPAPTTATEAVAPFAPEQWSAPAIADLLPCEQAPLLAEPVALAVTADVDDVDEPFAVQPMAAAAAASWSHTARMAAVHCMPAFAAV